MLKDILSIRFFFQATVWLLVFSFAWPVFAKTSNENIATKYIIKIKPNANPHVLEKVGFGIEKLFKFTSVPAFANIYSFESSLSEEKIKNIVKENFEYLEKSQDFKIAGIVTSDPGFTSSATDTEKQWALPKVGFDSAWAKTLGDKKNVIAVIDTGIDATHEDLKTINYVPGFDFFSRKPIEGNINSDDNGHGTLIAGILGATANNSTGIVGVNWDVSIMPLKALDQNGRGDSSKIIEAIVWAADHGAKIINLSIGGIGLGHNTALASAISYAFNKDIVIVAAAGNDGATVGTDLDIQPVFPICDDNDQNMVIGVTSVDINDQKPEFANFGKNCVDISAPGKRILTTINFDPITKKYAPNTYVFGSGTSLAVPYVVGQVALIRALYPNATNKQIRDRIISTADPVADLNLTQCAGSPCKGKLGSGRINVKKSLEEEIVISNASEGDLIKVEHSGLFYQIQGGKKRLVSPFVFNQKFLNTPFKTLNQSQIGIFPEGSYAFPKEGTLVKLDKDKTVYIIDKGQKRLVTAQIFKQRKFKYSNVSAVSFVEFNSWANGNYLPPEDGKIIYGYKNKNVYWVIDGVLHAMNPEFIKHRGLRFFPRLKFSDSDIAALPKGETYVR